MALASVLVGVLPAGTAHADGLKLDDALRLALSRNERARIARLRVDVAQGQLERARAAFLPSLVLGTQTQATPTADRSGRQLSNAATLTLNQPLLAPSAIPLYSQSSHQLKAEENNAVELQRQLAFDAAKAFVQALAAEQLLSAAEGRLDRARANLSNAEARASAGLTSTNDATRARVDVASAARDAATQVGSLERSRLNLALLVGAESVGQLEQPDELLKAAAAFQGDVEQMVSSSIERRPDIRASREQIKAAHEFAREPHYRMAPTIGLAAQVRANPDPLPPDKWHSESLTLTMTWTIFDGGARYGDRKARLAQAESAELDQRLLIRTVGVGVKASLASLSAARDAVRVAQESVDAARQNSEETNILYRQGLAKAIELTDANGKRFDAEVGLAQAKLALAQAYLDLRQAMGLFPVDIDLGVSDRRSSSGNGNGNGNGEEGGQ